MTQVEVTGVCKYHFGHQLRDILVGGGGGGMNIIEVPCHSLFLNGWLGVKRQVSYFLLLQL